MPTESLTPVVRTTLTADICRKMVSHLIRGVWSEGEKIPAERELSSSTYCESSSGHSTTNPRGGETHTGRCSSQDA